MGKLKDLQYNRIQNVLRNAGEIDTPEQGTVPDTDINSSINELVNKTVVDVATDDGEADIELTTNLPNYEPPKILKGPVDNDVTAKVYSNILDQVKTREDSGLYAIYKGDYTKAIDMWFPSAHIDPGETVMGVKDAYLNPTFLQSVINGLFPGNERDIADYSERRKYAKEHGIPIYDTIRDTTGYVIGEMLQFYTVFRLAKGLAGNYIVPTLARFGAIQKGKGVLKNVETINKIGDKIPGKTLGNDIKTLLSNQDKLATGLLTAGGEVSYWSAVEGDFTEALIFALGVPHAFKYAVIPGLASLSKKVTKGFGKLTSTEAADTVKVTPQSVDEIMPITKMKDITQKALDELDQANKSGNEASTEKLLTELGEIRKEDLPLINDIDIKLADFEKEVNTALNKFNKITKSIYTDSAMAFESPALQIKTGRKTTDYFTATTDKQAKQYNQDNAYYFLRDALDEIDVITNKFTDKTIAGLAPGKFVFTPKIMGEIRDTIRERLYERLRFNDEGVTNIMNVGGVKNVEDMVSKLVKEKFDSIIANPPQATTQAWYKALELDGKSVDEQTEIISDRIKEIPILKKWTNSYNRLKELSAKIADPATISGNYTERVAAKEAYRTIRQLHSHLGELGKTFNIPVNRFAKMLQDKKFKVSYLPSKKRLPTFEDDAAQTTKILTHIDGFLKELDAADLSPTTITNRISKETVSRFAKRQGPLSDRILLARQKPTEIDRVELNELIDDYIDTVETKAVLALHNIDTVINKANLDKLAAKQKRIRIAKKQLEDDMFTVNGKLAKKGKELEDSLAKLANNAEINFEFATNFKKIKQTMQAVKTLSKYYQSASVATRTGSIDEAVGKAFVDLDRQVNTRVRVGTTYKNKINAEYDEFVRDAMQDTNITSNLINQHRMDINEIFSDIITKQTSSAPIKSKIRGAVYKEIVSNVYDDMFGIYSSIKAAGKLTSRMEDIVQSQQAAQTIPDKIKTAYAFTKELLNNPDALDAAFDKTSPVRTFIHILQSINNPHFRNLVKEKFSKENLGTAAHELLINLAQDELQQGPFNVSKLIEFNEGLQNQDLLDLDKGMWNRLGRYIFKENHNIIKQTGWDEMVMLHKEIGNKAQSFTRETGRGGRVERLVNDMEKELNNTLKTLNQNLSPNQEKFTAQSIDEIIVALDKLQDTQAGQIAADKLFNSLPDGMQKYLLKYYQTLKDAGELFNKEVTDLNEHIKRGIIFEDVSTETRFVDDIELPVIEFRDFYFPRFNDINRKLNSLEKFDVFIDITSKDKTTRRLRIKDKPLNTVEEVYDAITKDAEVRDLIGNDINIQYKIRPITPMALPDVRSDIPSAGQTLMAGIENLYKVDLAHVKANLKSQTYNVKTFTHDVFTSGPSFSKQRTGLAGEYEQNHLTALNIYLNREARYRSFLKPVVQHDAMQKAMKKNPLLDKNGNPMKNTMAFMNNQIDEMLGRPNASVKFTNDLIGETINKVTAKNGKLFGVIKNDEAFDVRQFIDATNTWNYYAQFAIDLPQAFLQSSLAFTSMAPSAGKYAFQNWLKYVPLTKAESVRKTPAGKLTNLLGLQKIFNKRFDKLKQSDKDAVTDLSNLFEDMNLNIDNAHARLLADQHIQTYGKKARSWLANAYHQLGDGVTYLFRQGDIIPRKYAASIAYNAADDVMNNVAKQLNKLDIDWISSPQNIKKVKSLLRQKGITLNPLEMEAMELMVSSAKRTYSAKIRPADISKKATIGGIYTKEKVGMQWKYKASRDFKKDLAKNFSEYTNHRYDASHNSAFMNETLLKPFNLYKKFAIKEWGRLAGLAGNRQYSTLMASLLGYGTLAGGMGLPFARDIIKLAELGYFHYQSAFGTERPNEAMLDLEAYMRSYSADKPLLRMSMFGLGSTMNVDFSTSASVNMEGYFSARTPINSAVDLLQFGFGDAYRRSKNTFNRLTNAMNNPFAEDSFGKSVIRGLETVQDLVPGLDVVVKGGLRFYNMMPKSPGGANLNPYGSFNLEEQPVDTASTLDAFLAATNVRSMDEIAYMRNINSTKLKDSSILLNKARDRNTRAIVKLVIDFAGIQNPTDEEIKDFKAEIAERSEVFNTGDSLSNRVENLIKRQLLPKEYNILLKGNLDDTLLLLRNADVIFNQKKNDRKFKLRR